MSLTFSACAARVIVLGVYRCLCVSLCQLDKYFSEVVVLHVEIKIQVASNSVRYGEDK